MTDERGATMMRRVIATVAAVLLAVPAVAAGYHHVAGAGGEETVISGCTVRFSGGSPWILANAGHRATGCESVRVDPRDGFLFVDLGIDDAVACPVITTLTQSDETLTSRGIVSGVSSGTHELRVQFTDLSGGTAQPLDLRKAEDYAKVNFSTATNVWLGAVHHKGGDCR